jgi:hypothetical protein
MADFERLDKAIEAVKNTQVPAGPSQDLTELTLHRLQAAAEQQDAVGEGEPQIGWASVARRFWPLAAAAMLMAGFFVGRLTQPRSISRPDLASLEQSLYNRLQETLASDVQAAQVQTYRRVVSDVNAALDQRLPMVAAEVLLASNSTTTQVIRDLVQIIRTNQVQQQKEFATALELIESDRLRDQAQLNTRFASFAAATERGIAFLAGRQAAAEPSTQTRQPFNTERN